MPDSLDGLDVNSLNRGDFEDRDLEPLRASVRVGYCGVRYTVSYVNRECTRARSWRRILRHG